MKDFKHDASQLSDTDAEPLRAALVRIQQGKTPATMDDPYTGKPMNRAQRRKMKARVTKRIKQKEKER